MNQSWKCLCDHSAWVYDGLWDCEDAELRPWRRYYDRCVYGADHDDEGGMSPILAIVAAVIVCTVLGILIERIAYKPLRNASSSLAVLITAIGVSYLLQNTALLVFGANAQTFPSVKWKGLSLAGGKLNISGETIVTIAACVVIMIVLMLFVQKSKAGSGNARCIGR